MFPSVKIQQVTSPSFFFLHSKAELFVRAVSRAPSLFIWNFVANWKISLLCSRCFHPKPTPHWGAMRISMLFVWLLLLLFFLLGSEEKHNNSWQPGSYYARFSTLSLATLSKQQGWDSGWLCVSLPLSATVLNPWTREREEFIANQHNWESLNDKLWDFHRHFAIPDTFEDSKRIIW